MKLFKLLLIMTLIAGFVFAIQSPTADAQEIRRDGIMDCATFASWFSGVRPAYLGITFGTTSPFEQAVYTITVTGVGGTTGTARLVADMPGSITLAGPANLPATFTYVMPGPGSQPPGLGVIMDTLGGSDEPTLDVSISCGFHACQPAIPPQAVVGHFNWNSEIYWAPGHQVMPMLYVEAGNTYYVAGQDETEQYYKVLIACEWVWVRKDTMGPNYDEVWQGRPLPTTIVE